MAWFLDNALSIAGGITAFIVCWEAIQRFLKSGKTFFYQPSEELKKEVSMTLKDIVDRLDKIEGKLERVSEKDDDLCRVEMCKIYNKYRKYKKIPQYSAKDFHKLYRLYEGNSYAEELYNQVIEWEVVASEEEIWGEDK